jgi:branched-chain amino acid transport system substrate-binding protein
MPRTRVAAATAAAVLWLAAVAASGCDAHPAKIAAQGTLRIGALLPMSGRSAPSGIAMAAAARLATKEINDAGGVLGRRIELIIGDDACDPGTAVSAANAMVARDIAVSVGGYCSSATVPTLGIFRAAGVPMIIAASNSTELLAPQYNSVFLLSGTVSAEAIFALAQLRRMHSQRLAIIHDGTSFPATLAAATAAGAAGAGITTTANLKLSQGAPNYERIASTVLQSQADAVYYTGYYGEAHQLIIDLAAVGFRGSIIVGDGAIDDQLLSGLTAAQTEHLYGTSLPIAEFIPGLADWSAAYRSAVGTSPGANTLEAYDAVRLAADAIRRAGSADHAGIRAAIAATSGLTLRSGAVRFNPDGTRIDPTFLLLAVRQGAFVLAQEATTT